MITFAFFGTDTFSITVLEELRAAQLLPKVIVTAPPRPQGRGLELTPSPVAVWAQAHSIETLTPEVLDAAFIQTMGAKFDLFVLASYGLIIPQHVLDIPRHGTLNVHPSLLPKYRGASPIESAMLNDDKETGVTVMLMDNKMDHGPIVAQEVVRFDTWPQKPVAEETLAKAGGRLLAATIPEWIAGNITARPQAHRDATFTRKLVKADGELNLADDPYKNFLKIQAFTPWPGTFFFTDVHGKTMRVKITSATYENGQLKILRVVPEGRKEVDYDVFLGSNA
ncbi:MAG: hypothetical protein RL150_241 [Candidatus Parcubacteria bacterium]|jgi:methionyl-tRNA formyltransferase